MDKITELMQERAEAIAKQRKLVDTAEAEDRGLNPDERVKFNNMETEIDALEARIADLKKVEEKEKKAVLKSHKVETKEGEKDIEYRDAFFKLLRRGRGNLEVPEIRALQVATDSEGGYLVPTTFANSLLQGLEERNIMRQLCTVSSTSSEKKIPVAQDTGVATWVAEEGAYIEGDPTFSQKTVDAYKAGTIIKVSEELLADNTYNLEGYIKTRFVRRIGDLEETAYISGDGSGKPRGFLLDAQAAFTAAAAAAITADELIDAYHALGRPYRKKANWLFNDNTAKGIRKLKDTQGNYLWQPGLQAGQPDALLGKSVQIASDMPDMSASNKAIAFGDFSYYEIFDREGIYIQVLRELYATTGQIGFKAYKRMDGLLLLPEAVKVVTMAAA